jgi:putative DNA primase/helicase
MTAAELARALDRRARGRAGSWSCRCPAHEDHNPSLSIRDADDGRILVHCHAGCDQGDVIAELQHRGLWPERAARPASRRRTPARPRPALPPAGHHNTASAKAIWRTADEIIVGTPVELYLRHRGLWPADDDVGAFWPWAHLRCALEPLAMVAAVNDPVGNLVAVHRTFLTAAGEKAPIDKPKLARGPIKGNAVRLADWRTTDTLALTEGIEDALAYWKLTGTPTWAACGAGMVASMILPTAIRNVVIVADRDEAGMRAAGQALAAFEAQGRHVRVVRPIRCKDAAEVAESLA